MSGPRPLHPPAVAVTLALALTLALVPVAGLSTVGAPDSAQPTDRSRDVGTTGDAGLDAVDPVEPDRNTTAYLTLAEPTETRRFGTATFDVGGAVAADGARTHSTYEETWLRSAFLEAGDNRTRRQLIVERAADRIDARITALERRERRALQQYNAGEITTRTYLRELAAIDRAAGSLRGAVDLLHTYSSAVDSPVPDRRIAAQKARLLPLEGPVRDRVADAMRGEASTARVYVETSSEGVVLATIDRGPFAQEYLREAYVPSARNLGGIDRFERSDNRLRTARDRAAELYPWAFENRGPTSTGSFAGEPFLYNAGVYSVRVGHPHGTSRTYDLVTFLDGATRDVFREIQYKDLSTIPTATAGTNESDGLNVTVDRTRTGGPMLVTARNATTGEPVRVDVRVDGARVGTTDVDGRRWIIAPGPTARITLVSGNRSVSTTVFSDGAPSG